MINKNNYSKMDYRVEKLSDAEIDEISKHFDKRVPCEVFSRVVGYFRPVNNWNAGKQAEFKDRLEYDLEKSLESKYCNDMNNGNKSINKKL